MLAKPKWHGDGIFSKTRARDGKTVYYAQYWHEGKRITEKGGTTLLQAQKLRLRRLDEIDNRRFVHPGLKKQQAREEAQAKVSIAAARVDLIFENAVKRFTESCGNDYADPGGVTAAFGRLALAFKGRCLDEIGRRDVLEYERDRLHNTGPFSEWKRKVGLRAPRGELTFLSALYSYLIADEEREGIVNPCRSVGGRRGRTKTSIYRPVRKPVIADRAQRLALFRGARDPEMRALLKLAYYTAARPESEACRLLHGDVEIPDAGKVRALDGSAVIGHVTYRNTKTGQDRCVPLHPRAVRALQRVMIPRPSEAKALEAWEGKPIFRRADGTPWDVDSYRKRWKTVLEAIEEEHPELQTMIVRDLRKTANTEMRSKGTDTATAARILGHSSEMNYRYVEATDAAAERAILAL